MRLDMVKILAVSKPIASVTVNEKQHSDFFYNVPNQVCIRIVYVNLDYIIVFRFYLIDSTYL